MSVLEDYGLTDNLDGYNLEQLQAAKDKMLEDISPDDDETLDRLLGSMARLNAYIRAAEEKQPGYKTILEQYGLSDNLDGYNLEQLQSAKDKMLEDISPDDGETLDRLLGPIARLNAYIRAAKEVENNYAEQHFAPDI